MEPRIRYAKTEDGVNIAFWTIGEGTPLIHMPPAFTHIQLEWQFPELRRWYERLAQKRKLIRFDTRGFGLSQREVPDLSPDSLSLDLEAVVGRLGLERFALLGYQHSGPVAIAYAARRPERVSHLILWSAYAEPAEWTASPQVQAIRGLLDKDWATYTETVAHIIMGWSHGEPARRFAELIRECTTPDQLKAGIRATLGLDVRALLPKVRSPALVLHRRQVPFPAMSTASGLAAGIPDARLAVLEGESLAPYLGDSESVLRAIDEFLSEGEEEAAGAERPISAPTESGTATILFADIANSTALTERMGDAAFRDNARDLDTALRSAISAAGGTAVEGKLLGDGVLAVFGAAREAIACSSACHAAAEENGLELHVGIHAGDVIREEGNVFGGAVNIAARVADASGAGETLVSQTVRDLARTSAGVAFEDRGEHELKGIDEPQRLWSVRWRKDA